MTNVHVFLLDWFADEVTFYFDYYIRDCVFARFAKVFQPLQARRSQLEKVKQVHQFLRDVEDEKLWISEKMPQATSTDYGNSLLSVHTLQKRNKSLRAEIDHHERRLQEVVDVGRFMIEENHPQSEEFQEQIDDLLAKWDDLNKAVDNRKRQLELSEIAQQVRTYFIHYKYFINIIYILNRYFNLFFNVIQLT